MSQIPTIDGRILDTDNRFNDYCDTFGITNPFCEERQRLNKRMSKQIVNGHEITFIDPEGPDDLLWRIDWTKRRNEYLRLDHTFRLWDFHFWMPWEKFKWHCGFDKEYTDVSIYMPCDCADRQCSMECAYFLHECPREKEELKTPEILGFEGRWEYHDNYD